MPSGEFEVFPRVKRCRAFDPWVDGVGRDDIELFIRIQKEVARIVV